MKIRLIAPLFITLLLIASSYGEDTASPKSETDSAEIESSPVPTPRAKKEKTPKDAGGGGWHSSGDKIDSAGKTAKPTTPPDAQ